jgi:lipid-binding SYLF domain-containing protein
MEGVTADLLSFGRTKGAFMGMALKGALVAISDDSNQAYYGKPVRPTDIVVRKSVTNPGSADLRSSMAALTAK